jgi:hypothetical protein
MRKTLLAGCLVTLSAVTLIAGPCSTTMNINQLSALTSTGCEFAGYNFSDFNISGYIDLATTASNGYNFLDHHTPGDNAKDNYLVTFSAPSATSFQLAFTGAVLFSDGRGAWSLDTSSTQDASSNFGFSITYHINSVAGQGDVNNLHHGTTGLAGVTYTGPAGADASTSLVKTVTDGNGANAQDINAAMYASSGSKSKTMALLPNTTGTLIVNDVFFEQITNVTNGHLTTTTLINAFDAPEPMTIGLMGFGLLGLGLLRRRLGRA